MKNQYELEPCPFCAGNLTIDIENVEDGGGIAIVHDDIGLCIMGDLYDITIPLGATAKDIARIVNTRPIEDALRAEIARLTAEIEQLSNREISLLSHLKNNGKLLKAGGEFDEYNFDRYLTPVNAAYVDGLIFQHNSRVKDVKSG